MAAKCGAVPGVGPSVQMTYSGAPEASGAGKGRTGVAARNSLVHGNDRRTSVNVALHSKVRHWSENRTTAAGSDLYGGIVHLT